MKSPEVMRALLHPDAPGDTRCTTNDGKRWRCSRVKVEGSRFCSRHEKLRARKSKVHSIKKVLGGTDGDANGNGNGAHPDKEGSGSGNGESLKKLDGGPDAYVNVAILYEGVRGRGSGSGDPLKKLDGGPDAYVNVAILDAGVNGRGSGDPLKKLDGGAGADANANANGAVPDAGGSGIGIGSGGGGGGTGEMRVASPGDDKTALGPATLPSSTGRAAPELDLRELKQLLQLKLAESTARVDKVNISYIICFSVCLFGLHHQVSMKR